MEKNKTTPNQIPVSSRIFRIVGSLALIAYGIYGLSIDDLVLPSKRGGIHLHGLPSWIMGGAMLCASLAMLSVVIDHYDRNDNEDVYRSFGEWASRGAYILFGSSLGLNIAGINYPGVSNPTASSVFFGILMFCGGLFFAVWKKASIANVSQASVPASGVGTNIGRVLGIVLVALGLPVLVLSVPWLLRFEFRGNVLASIAIVLLSLGVFSFRHTPLVVTNSRSDSDKLASKWVKIGEQAAFPSKWLPVRIGTLLLVGIWVVWYTWIDGLGAARWKDEDEMEHKRAPPWTYQIEDLRFGVSMDVIQRRLSSEGFRIKCYGNLQPQEKLDPTDTHVCWTIANNVHGISSRMITFHFGDDGLHHVIFDFPKNQWPAVHEWFRRQKGHDAGYFGYDHDRSQIVGRRVETGVLMTSKPIAVNWVMVTWDARDRVFETLCRARDLTTEQQKLLCQGWPAPVSQSAFVGGH